LSRLLLTCQSRLHDLRRLCAPALCLGLAACGGGGGGGAATAPAGPTVSSQSLAVLIAQGDPTSEAIGLAYQRARGIPDAHVLRLAVPRGSDVMSAEDFTVLKASLDAQLPSQVQATLVTWTQPSRVLGTCAMGLTSALALGYDTRYCGGCRSTSASPYYNNNSLSPYTELQIRPSMMLGAATLADAEALIGRGLAADRSWAAAGVSGQAFLVRTSDASRSVRHPDFQSLVPSPVPGLTVHYRDNSAGGGSDVVSNESRVMFYLTGLPTVPDIQSNRYLPGAVADHLTSAGGVLSRASGQMPVTDWLAAGATASYGTVEEPCNFVEKFPRASVLIRRYQRGETLIEAYWKSVQWPGQGLFVGEPLARPWAP
jgi:uncharacterized protein (TIGR03790 family)